MENTKPEWFFIINPRAGSGKTMSEWIPAEKKIEKLGIPYTTAFTDHERHAVVLAAEAAGAGYRKIISVGGDGSMHETFNGIMEWCDKTGTSPEEFTIGVIPIGSGNDWIKEMKVPKDTMEAVDVIAAGRTAKMDVVRVDSDGGKTTYMANVGGVGFDSHVCIRVNMQKAHGKRNKMIYLNALRYTLTHMHPINLKLVADGCGIYSGPLYSISLGNGRYSGGGMQQTPDARIDDGKVDMMVCPKMSLVKIGIDIPKLLKGNINEAKYLKFARFSKLEIIPADSQSCDEIELDGEIEGRLPATVTVGQRRINALCGPQYTRSDKR